MKHNSMPTVLPVGAGVLTKAGQAPEPGGTRYLDLRTNGGVTVYEALVTNTGPRFSLAAVRDSNALNRVRINNASRLFGVTHLAIGEMVLLTVNVSAEGPVAGMVWPLASPQPAPTPEPKPPRSPVRFAGLIVRVHPSGRFGEIRDDGTGCLRFAHRTACTKAELVVGNRVSFLPAESDRGPLALDVQAA